MKFGLCGGVIWTRNELDMAEERVGGEGFRERGELLRVGIKVIMIRGGKIWNSRLVIMYS